METMIFEAEDENFIQRAVKFCNGIDKYTGILGLNAKEVEELKGDVNMAAYITTRYPHFTPAFIQYNIQSLRDRYAELCTACLRSKKYNRYMGIELGMETTWAVSSFSPALPGSWFLGVINRIQDIK